MPENTPTLTRTGDRQALSSVEYSSRKDYTADRTRTCSVLRRRFRKAVPFQFGARLQKESAMNICPICNKETKNPKFCSRSCSAVNSNKTSPKRSIEGNCDRCHRPISKRNKFCKKCFEEGLLGDLTLGEAIYTKHHKSSAYALVRARARKVCTSSSCKNCGYEKHTEVCHIKSIGDFSLDTKLSEINSLDNLVRLCPNCHWEFDNGRLRL